MNGALLARYDRGGDVLLAVVDHLCITKDFDNTAFQIEGGVIGASLGVLCRRALDGTVMIEAP
jgi:hypothetical protein